MGRPEQLKYVSTNTILASNVTTTAPAPFQLTNPFPVGDLVYSELHVRITGALDTTNGGGSVITDGGLAFMRSLYFSTPQHSMIYENLDGINLIDMLTVKNRKKPLTVDVASTAASDNPSFEYTWSLPFKDKEAYNYSDLGLDCLRSGQPLLQLNLGVYSDFVSSGGADAVTSYNLESHLTMDPGPIDYKNDAPKKFQPYYGKLRFAVSSTVAQQSIQLAFGDRIFKRIYITQRNSSTFARLANTVIGVATTDRISLRVNSNVIWVDRIAWGALQAQNARDYKLDAMPTGVAVIDFVKPLLGGIDGGGGTDADGDPKAGSSGAKLSDALSVLSKNQGTLELLADVTTVTNGVLDIIYEAAKIIPLGARRPAPQPQGT